MWCTTRSLFPFRLDLEFLVLESCDAIVTKAQLTVVPHRQHALEREVLRAEATQRFYFVGADSAVANHLNLTWNEPLLDSHRFNVLLVVDPDNT